MTVKNCKTLKKLQNKVFLDSTNQNMLTEMIAVELKCFVLLHRSYQIVPIGGRGGRTTYISTSFCKEMS